MAVGMPLYNRLSSTALYHPLLIIHCPVCSPTNVSLRDLSTPGSRSPQLTLSPTIKMVTRSGQVGHSGHITSGRHCLYFANGHYHSQQSHRRQIHRLMVVRLPPLAISDTANT